MTRVNLLGGVEISGGGAPLSSRAMTLLAYLVAHAEAPQPRGHLADVLWPDSDSGQARTNLRRELHHLRGAVDGTGCLEVTGTALTWHHGPGCEVDVRRFLEARRRALVAVDSDDSEFVGQSQRALDCYRGSFLPGCYDDWALLVRDELEAAYLDLCDRAAHWQEQRDDLGAAISLVRRRLALEPLDEPGYGWLISLQRRSGDRAGAMRTYHRCASVLERELGVSPSPETHRELDLVMVEQGSGPAAAPRRWPTGEMARSSPELVGREAERHLLRELWSASTSGSRLVLVTGEAGMGKTSLVADLAAEVARQHGAVAAARCFAATKGLPLAPVAEWLRDPHLRVSTAGLEPVWRAEVERLVPTAAVTSDPAQSSRAKVDAWQRLRFFEGLARAVLAVEQPLLLVVDDLQWCDHATFSWLSFLTSLPTSTQLLVIGTAREDELDPAGPLGAMDAAGQLVSVALGPLPAEATAQLASRAAGRALSTEELELVHSVTAGNPFYVVEALRDSDGSSGPVNPADLEGVLLGRISRVSEPAQQVLGLASAVGRDFRLDLLAEASDLEPDLVVQAVDELWRRRIIEQRGQGYDFAHDLLRAAAYDAVAPARRWLLHRRLAQALELLYADSAELVATELAEHYDRSGQPERAFPFYDRAARQAAAVFAHAEAVRLWQRCWALLDATPTGRARDERELTIIGQLLPPLNASRGYADEELEAYERRWHELGGRLDLVEVRATAAVALFATTYVQGHLAEAYRWSEQALDLAEEVPDVAGQAHMGLAGSALALGRVRLASEHFDRACELAGESDSLPIGTRTEVHARSWGAHALWLLGDEAGARAAADQGVRVARAIDHPYSLAVALSYAGLTYQMLGDLSALEATLDELTVVCDRYEFAYYPEWAAVLSGWLRGGDEGRAQLQRGIDRLTADGALARMPYWLWLLADLNRTSGDTHAALEALREAEAVAERNGDVWWLPEVLRLRAALGEGRAARKDLQRALALAEEHESVWLVRRCRADLALI